MGRRAASRLRRSRRVRDEGASAVEFGLLLPLFVMLDSRDDQRGLRLPGLAQCHSRRPGVLSVRGDPEHPGRRRIHGNAWLATGGQPAPSTPATSARRRRPTPGSVVCVADLRTVEQVPETVHPSDVRCTPRMRPAMVTSAFCPVAPAREWSASVAKRDYVQVVGEQAGGLQLPPWVGAHRRDGQEHEPVRGGGAVMKRSGARTRRPGCYAILYALVVVVLVMTVAVVVDSQLHARGPSGREAGCRRRRHGRRHQAECGCRLSQCQRRHAWRRGSYLKLNLPGAARPARLPDGEVPHLLHVLSLRRPGAPSGAAGPWVVTITWPVPDADPLMTQPSISGVTRLHAAR